MSTKIAKSELKQMIREALREELAVVKTLKESVDTIKGVRIITIWDEDESDKLVQDFATFEEAAKHYDGVYVNAVDDDYAEEVLYPVLDAMNNEEYDYIDDDGYAVYEHRVSTTFAGVKKVKAKAANNSNNNSNKLAPSSANANYNKSEYFGIISFINLKKDSIKIDFEENTKADGLSKIVDIIKTLTTQEKADAGVAIYGPTGRLVLVSCQSKYYDRYFETFASGWDEAANAIYTALES